MSEKCWVRDVDGGGKFLTNRSVRYRGGGRLRGVAQAVGWIGELVNRVASVPPFDMIFTCAPIQGSSNQQKQEGVENEALHGIP